MIRLYYSTTLVCYILQIAYTIDDYHRLYFKTTAVVLYYNRLKFQHP